MQGQKNNLKHISGLAANESRHRKKIEKVF